jgi:gliding motility-associated-like protein
MIRVLLLVSFLFLISVSAKVNGQCPNSPTITLSANSGNTCGIQAITVSGNMFGGSATSVTISENGSGSVSPTSTKTSPFSFTYTPKSGDSGKKITITLTTNNPLGLICSAAKATYVLTLNATPTPPTAGTITKPTCTVSTGSVILNGLPSTGAWNITSNPGGTVTTGTGVSTTISALTPGTYSFTVSNAAGCSSASSADIVIPAQPVTPASPAEITDCSAGVGKAKVTVTSPVGTGLTYSIDGGSFQTGTSFSVLKDGSHIIAVKNSSGCSSSSSFAISCGCVNPPAPIVGSIIPPTCSLTTGSVTLNGLPVSGSWTLTRYPGMETTTGAGSSATLSALPAGAYSYTLTTSSGCISAKSADVIIPSQPAMPTPPVIGEVTQPAKGLPTGSVVLNGLPSTGLWVIAISPGNTIYSGTGTTKTISDLSAGTYSFLVTNSAGCTSDPSASIGITELSGTANLIVNNPQPVCVPSTINLTDPKITEGTAANLILTYWKDAAASVSFSTPGAATTGVYFIKATSSDGLYSIKPVTVSVYQIPVAKAGPDQTLSNVFRTTMDAELVNNYETGVWSVISGKGDFSDPHYPKSGVSGLASDKNIFQWTVTNGVCPSSSDTVVIRVSDLIIPTLITPNMDGRNDYFVIKGPAVTGKMQLIIFDRRGVTTYKSDNYNNLWNGVDYNGNPLPDDTYFYLIKLDNGRSSKGFIVIKR